MAARNLHSQWLAALGYVGPQVLATELQSFLCGGRCQLLFVIEQCARLAKDPGVFNCTPPHHDTGAVRLGQCALGILGRADVAIYQHWDLHRGLSARRPRPVGGSAVTLLGGAAVNGQRRHPDIFQASRQIKDGHVRLGTPADSRLDRDR